MTLCIMKSLDFYQWFYDRELKRRFDLDSSLNIPIGLIVILMGLISYTISDLNFSDDICLHYVIAALTIISVILIFLSIYFLAKSYNNFFKGHRYLNFALTKEIREFETNLKYYNSQVNEEKKIELESQIIEKMNCYTDNHTLVNDYRQINLHNAKSFIIISIFLVLISQMLLIINQIYYDL